MKKYLPHIVIKTLDFIFRIEIFITNNIHTRFTHKNTTNYKSLLLVKIDGIGDFILFSPFIPEYANLYKNHRITLIVIPACLQLAKKICAPIKQISKIIPFDNREFQRNYFYKRRIIATIRNEEASIAIQPTFSRSYAGDLIVKSSGAAERIGYDREWRNDFYTKPIESDTSLHSEIDINEHFLRAIGGKIKDSLPHLEITNEEKLDTQKILEENGLSKNGKYVLIQLGAGAPCRQWPIAKFAEVTKYLTEKRGLFCVLTGTPKEKHLSAKLLDSVIKEESKIIDLTGKTSLVQVAAIAKGALLYFGNETGTLHLCAAVGSPTVCILGGGHFGRFFPYGDSRKNLIVYDKNMKCLNDNWACSLSHPNEIAPCLKNVNVEDAIKQIDKILDKEKC